MYGLGVKKDPYEAPLPTGQEKFQSVYADQGAYYAVGSRLPRERKRMAGDILNLDLTQSPGPSFSIPAPNIGSAELRAIQPE